MFSSSLLQVVFSLGAALALQAPGSSREPSRPYVGIPDDAEAMRLIREIETSLRAAMPGAEITSSLTPDDVRDMARSYLASEYNRRAAELADGLSEHDADLAADSVSRDFGRARRDVEEMEEDTETAATMASDCVADGAPPATGLRRWVIRIRNFMFGRRDLEGNDDGEEEGEPESGRTWMESLARWFAHGIKRILVRISGSSEEAEDPEAETMPNPGEAAPAPSVRRPEASTRAPPTTARPGTSPTPAAPAPTQNGGSNPAVTAEPEAKPKAKPEAKPEVVTPSTVFDDEAFHESRAGQKVSIPVDETNELN